MCKALIQPHYDVHRRAEPIVEIAPNVEADEADEADDVALDEGVFPENEEPVHVLDPVLGEDADTRFWLMVIRWMVRGRFGYVELGELMHFLFSSNVDLASITLRTIPKFKRFDQDKQESKSRGRWSLTEVGGELRIPFRYRSGKEAVEALYCEAANFEGDDFEWVPKRVSVNNERVYSTPATGKWWASAQVCRVRVGAIAQSP